MDSLFRPQPVFKYQGEKHSSLQINVVKRFIVKGSSFEECDYDRAKLVRLCLKCKSLTCHSCKEMLRIPTKYPDISKGTRPG